MAFTFNPFTGNLDNTPSTKKGNDAYTFLQETSSSFLAFPIVTPLTGDGTTFVFNISGAENIDNPAAIVVTIDGAIQEPVYSYTVSNNVLTFAAPPASGTRIFTMSPNGTKAVGILTGDNRIFSAYNTVNALSSDWSNVYSTVQGNSATNWDNSLVTLTTLGLEDAMKSYDAGGLWDVTKGWTAALVDNGIFTLLLSEGKTVNLKGTYLTNSTTDYELTNWQNTFTNAKSNSGYWQSAYTNLVTNSAAYLSAVDLNFLSVSADWNNVYTQVRSNSATNWDNNLANQYTHTNFLPLSGGTMSGTLSTVPTSIRSGLNIGAGVNPSSTIVGDLWIGTQNLQWRSGAGSFTAAPLNSQNTFSQNQIISVNTSSAALRVTQQGAGNALLIEDSTNPDSTPFAVDANGTVGIGLSSLSGVNAKLTVIGNISATGTIFGDYVLANPPVTLPFGASTFNPSVNTSIYIASFSDLAPLLVTSSPQRYIVAQARGLIDSVSRMYFNTVTNASSEGSRLTLINITQNLSSLITDNAICGNGTTAGRSQHDIYTLANPLTAERGDLLAIRWDTANWVTAPTNVRLTFLTILKPF